MFVVAIVVVVVLFALYLVKARTPEQAGADRPTRSERANIASTTPNDGGAESMASPEPGEVGPAQPQGRATDR